MRKHIQTLLPSAEALATDRDIYDGQSAPLTFLPDNIVLFTRKTLRPQDFAGAIHHRYVLILFLKTPGTVLIQNRQISAREGHAVLIRPFEPHYYALPGKPVVWLFITFELPEDRRLSLPRSCCRLTDDALQTLDSLVNVYRAGDPQKTRLLSALFLHELNRSQAPSPDSKINPDRKTVGNVNRYIHDHLDEPFTIDRLAECSGMSASHLRLVFRKTMGVSLGGYIRRIRFDRAGHLLKTTRLTVSEIAYQCGFASPSVFCRAFKKKEGLAPSAFRKKALGSSAPPHKKRKVEPAPAFK